MQGESGATRSIIRELHSSDIQPCQMDVENGVTGTIIDEVHSSYMVKWKVKVVLPEV